ncbi:hypothetical protein C8R45DRAFT_252068 [Mycena sanguinolenta]|nr:hypothetical protein C8R45DRAFT_252068 [Mycena sanguinolenta]
MALNSSPFFPHELEREFCETAAYFYPKTICKSSPGISARSRVARNIQSCMQRNQINGQGFGDLLRQGSAHACEDCNKNPVHLAAQQMHQFAGVRLCEACRREWDAYVVTLPERAVQKFPILQPLLRVRRG